MKYKIGDKARVRSDLVLYGKTYGGLSFTTAMSEFKGKTVTIKLVLGNKYRLVEDTGRFAWSDEMLEDVDEEFKLPEKWCIKSTKENIESLGKYWDDGCRMGKLYSRKEMFPYWIGQYWCSYNLTSGNLLFSEEPGSNHMIYSKPEKLLEITFDQFKKYVIKSEATPVKEEVKFEVGKWYNNLGIDECYYGKLSDTLGEGRFPCKEFISPNGTYYDNGGFFSDFKFATECNLSEIQQYLPENHPDKIKRKTKKVEDLRYPDVVHCSSKEQHDKINSFAGLMGYDGDKWYLTGSYGRASKPYDEAGGKGYTNYEFSDIIFPEEKVIDKEDEEFKVGAYIVFIDSFGGSKKGDIDKIRRVDSAEQIFLVKEGLSWGRLGEGFDKKCKYFLILKEAQAFSDELLGKNKVETKPKLSKDVLVQTGMSQQETCDSCKYYGEECAKRKGCDATGGQHYPKDNLSKKYVVGIDPSDAESSSEGIEVGKFPLDRGMGLYEQKEKIHIKEMASRLTQLGWFYNLYDQADCKLETIDSDEIYVPIIKTEVKQIKL